VFVLLDDVNDVMMTSMQNYCLYFLYITMISICILIICKIKSIIHCKATSNWPLWSNLAH